VDNRVLLVFGDKPYAPHYNLWNALGGKFEKFDRGDPDKCNIRECAEEGGVRPINPVLLGVVTFFDCPYSGNVYEVFIYRANAYERVGRPGKSTGWFCVEPIVNLPVLEADKLVHIPLVVVGRYFTAKVWYQGRRYLRHKVDILDEPPSKE